MLYKEIKLWGETYLPLSLPQQLICLDTFVWLKLHECLLRQSTLFFSLCLYLLLHSLPINIKLLQSLVVSPSCLADNKQLGGVRMLDDPWVFLWPEISRVKDGAHDTWCHLSDWQLWMPWLIVDLGVARVKGCLGDGLAFMLPGEQRLNFFTHEIFLLSSMFFN